MLFLNGDGEDRNRLEGSGKRGRDKIGERRLIICWIKGWPKFLERKFVQKKIEGRGGGGRSWKRLKKSSVRPRGAELHMELLEKVRKSAKKGKETFQVSDGLPIQRGKAAIVFPNTPLAAKRATKKYWDARHFSADSGEPGDEGKRKRWRRKWSRESREKKKGKECVLLLSTVARGGEKQETGRNKKKDKRKKWVALLKFRVVERATGLPT